MNFVGKANWEKEGHPVHFYGPTLASIREGVRELFKSGAVKPGSQVEIYEIRQVLVECVEKPEPPKEETKDA